MNAHTPLALHGLSPEDRLVWPEDFHELTLESPATEIFTDFKRTRPLLIDHHTPAEEALRVMQETHVRLKIVVDGGGDVLGVVSSDDLTPERRLAIIGADAAHQEPAVEDLMVPVASLQAIEFGDLQNATIGRVVATLEHFGKQHCLVVDSGAHQIRGLISASDIARRLHIPVKIEKPPTFADIFLALKPRAA